MEKAQLPLCIIVGIRYQTRHQYTKSADFIFFYILVVKRIVKIAACLLTYQCLFVVVLLKVNFINL
jgi:hypothetical protein